MKRSERLKRFLSFFLCAAMILSYMPTPFYAYAEDGNETSIGADEGSAPAADNAEKKEEKKEEPAPETPKA